MGQLTIVLGGKAGRSTENKSSHEQSHAVFVRPLMKNTLVKSEIVSAYFDFVLEQFLETLIAAASDCELRLDCNQRGFSKFSSRCTSLPTTQEPYNMSSLVSNHKM